MRPVASGHFKAVGDFSTNFKTILGKSSWIHELFACNKLDTDFYLTLKLEVIVFIL